MLVSLVEVMLLGTHSVGQVSFSFLLVINLKYVETGIRGSTFHIVRVDGFQKRRLSRPREVHSE